MPAVPCPFGRWTAEIAATRTSLSLSARISIECKKIGFDKWYSLQQVYLPLQLRSFWQDQRLARNFYCFNHQLIPTPIQLYRSDDWGYQVSSSQAATRGLQISIAFASETQDQSIFWDSWHMSNFWDWKRPDTADMESSLPVLLDRCSFGSRLKSQSENNNYIFGLKKIVWN